VTVNLKKPKPRTARKQSPSAAAPVVETQKKFAGLGGTKRPAGEPTARTQLRKADEMLKRIEHKSEALSAIADRLLTRVS
jgi:hypothetical protein